MLPLSLAGALLITSDLRPLDAACIRAMTGNEPGEWFAVDRFQAHGVAFECVQDGSPWAMAGLSLPNAWTGVLWMVARPGLRMESWRKLVRCARKVLAAVGDPSCSEYRHRVEAHVLETWPEAQRFVRHLGFALEHTRRSAGSRGESVQVWVRIGPVKGI